MCTKMGWLKPWGIGGFGFGEKGGKVREVEEGIVAGEGIPYERSPATIPRRQVAGESHPQRQVAGENPILSLGKALNVIVNLAAKWGNVTKRQKSIRRGTNSDRLISQNAYSNLPLPLVSLSYQASACSLSTVHFLKFPENSFEVLKLPENCVEVLKILENKLESVKILENKLESLKLQENQPPWTWTVKSSQEPRAENEPKIVNECLDLRFTRISCLTTAYYDINVNGSLLAYKTTREAYANIYGPTIGDKIRLGDTNLFAEVERDFAVYGDECVFGGGKVIRDGMGQALGYSSSDCLDTVITNALIIDYTGIFKADIGIKGGCIYAIEKAGNPDAINGVFSNKIIGVSTELIAEEGKIVTAGAIDCGHAPDIMKVCGVKNVLPSSTNPTRPYTKNTIDEHLDMLVICRTWQRAHKIKLQRGSIDGNIPINDNIYIKRFFAKYTINPAIANGISDHVGSVEPSFFGAKPEMVIKGGDIAYANMGDPNASIPTPQPVMRPMFGALGKAESANSIAFVSKAAMDCNIKTFHGPNKKVASVKNIRKLNKLDMKLNDALPNIEIDPET
nr:urease isoform X1 [Tanacetum cinerariifolium]